MISVHGTIYEPGEAADPGAVTLRTLKRNAWDAAAAALVVRVQGGVLVIGPDIIGGLSDNTRILVQFKFEPRREAKRAKS